MIDTASDRAALQPYLLSGERVLWAGRPRQGLAITRRGANNFLFGLFFLVFAAIWTSIVLLVGEPWFALFGLLFVLVGLGLVIVRPILGVARRRRSVYAVTDQRILRLVGARLQSMSLDGLPPINLEESRDRSGTIFFGISYARQQPSFDGPETEHIHLPGLIDRLDRIDNVRTVYDLIQKEVERRRRAAAA